MSDNLGRNRKDVAMEVFMKRHQISESITVQLTGFRCDGDQNLYVNGIITDDSRRQYHINRIKSVVYSYITIHYKTCPCNIHCRYGRRQWRYVFPQN